jgi:hypothetical protein
VLINNWDPRDEELDLKQTRAYIAAMPASSVSLTERARGLGASCVPGVARPATQGPDISRPQALDSNLGMC